MSDKTFGESAFETLSKGYRSLVGAEDLPLDKRIYMESVIDRRKDPVTEKSLTADEREQLRSLITSRYAALKPKFQQDVSELRANAVEALREAAAARTQDVKQWHLKRHRSIVAMMEGLKSYLSTGKLNPVVVDYASSYGVKPNIQYQDYGDPTEVNSDAGARTRSTEAPDTRIGQTLGRFNYSVDTDGTITVKDTYDFGAGVNSLTGQKLENKRVSIGNLISPKTAAVRYGRTYLPEGKGRPVQIRINSAAPPPKPTQNWFSRAADFFGF